MTACAQGGLVGSCEGCEAVFEYGDRDLNPVDTLPDFGTTTPRIRLSGTVYLPDGETPAEGVILYIYHANRQGEYAVRGGERGWARRHGYTRGWVRTGPDGRYVFYTYRPGSYDGQPAHIHPILLEPDGTYYWVDAYTFAGDPNLEEHGGEGPPRGSSGLVTLRREDGLYVAERDFVLGSNVPGYR